MNELGIFYRKHECSNGPKKVADNLISGLTSLGIKVKENQKCRFNGCLHYWPGVFNLPKRTLVGPNTVVVPHDNPKLFASFKHHVCPSAHVKDLYEECFRLIHSRHEVKGNNLSVWSAGIDTELFYDFKKNIKTDYFIYFKNRERHEAQEVVEHMEKLNLTGKLIQYGHYREDQLIELIKECKFCILLTKSESQGIAYMEILSTNTPCYSLDKNRWEDRPGFEWDATSTPYFDERCGIKAMGLEKINEFLDKLNSYSPRQYILDSHTLKKSAQNYLKLIERSHE